MGIKVLLRMPVHYPHLLWIRAVFRRPRPDWSSSAIVRGQATFLSKFSKFSSRQLCSCDLYTPPSTYSLGVLTPNPVTAFYFNTRINLPTLYQFLFICILFPTFPEKRAVHPENSNTQCWECGYNFSRHSVFS